jgi:hypothetical protein
MHRLQWAAYKFAIFLMLLGVVLAGSALWLYLITPSANQYVAPALTSVSISSNVKVDIVKYRIFRPQQPIGEQIYIDLEAASPSARGSAVVQISLPHGKTFLDCRACGTSNSKTAKFVHGEAKYHWIVYGTRLAWVINLDTAEAVLPQLTYTGPGNPLLSVSYRGIHNANAYDWNTLATTLIQKDLVAWTVPTINGYAQAEVASGVNHRVDHILVNNGFITAALVGVGAGALLAAIQEARQVSSNRNRSEGVGHRTEPPDAGPKPE